MAKGKAGRNVIFISKDGKVAIASASGDLSVVGAAELSGEIAELIKKRQAVGKQLTEALAKAKFPVSNSVDCDVADPSGVAGTLGKRKKKS
jgi:hypothetical protein